MALIHYWQTASCGSVSEQVSEQVSEPDSEVLLPSAAVSLMPSPPAAAPRRAAVGSVSTASDSESDDSHSLMRDRVPLCDWQ